MSSIAINILAGCATQALISILLWHRNLLSLPKRVENIERDVRGIKEELCGLPEKVINLEKDVKEIKEDVRNLRSEMKAEFRELRGILARMNERIDNLIDRK